MHAPWKTVEDTELQGWSGVLCKNIYVFSPIPLLSPLILFPIFSQQYKGVSPKEYIFVTLIFSVLRQLFIYRLSAMDGHLW